MWNVKAGCPSQVWVIGQLLCWEEIIKLSTPPPMAHKIQTCQRVLWRRLNSFAHCYRQSCLSKAYFYKRTRQWTHCNDPCFWKILRVTLRGEAVDTKGYLPSSKVHMLLILHTHTEQYCLFFCSLDLKARGQSKNALTGSRLYDWFQTPRGVLPPRHSDWLKQIQLENALSNFPPLCHKSFPSSFLFFSLFFTYTSSNHLGKESFIKIW